MAMFHVYVDGPVETSPDAIRRLATTISAKYGLPAAELIARMSKGRFRVKANVDRATADTYAQALGEVGARVTIEDAVAPAAAAAPPVSVARAPAPPLPPSAAARPAISSLPPASAAKLPAAPMQSGLAAAFSGEASATNLGALDGLSLASLDGNDNEPAPGAFEPSPEIARQEPVARAGAAPARGKPPADVPLDLFAPPSDGAELKVELAIDEPDDRARKHHGMPPANVAPASPPLGATKHRKEPASQPPVGGVRGSDERPRGRFALGVFLAICLGFVPAHLFASWRESSAFSAIDAQVEATQRSSDTPEMYEALDAFRDNQLDRKKSERRNIALIAMVMWAAAGAGLGFVWFRKIPWGRQTA